MTCLQTTILAVLTFASLLLPSFTWSQDRPDDRIFYRYEVFGGSTLDPDRLRPWSESFDTQAAAEDRMREILRDHARGGLLESSPDHPVNLFIKKVPYRRSLRSDERPENPMPDESMPSSAKPSLNAKSTGADPKTTNANAKARPDKSDPNSIAGKRAYGTFGKSELVLFFGEDGQVTFTESGKERRQVGQGQWTQTGKAVTIETSNYLYMGLIDTNKIKGKRVPKRGSQTAEAWESVFDVPNSQNTIVGTTWNGINGQEGFIWTFRDAKRIESIHRHGDVKHTYSYRLDNDRIFITLTGIYVGGMFIAPGSNDEHECRVKNDSIQGTFNLRRK